MSEEIPSAIIIELSAIVQIKASSDAEICHTVLLTNGIVCFSRIDIVCDQYSKDSVKEQTRKGRGTGTRKLFDDNTIHPSNTREDLLRHSQNKEGLNRYLAGKIISLHSGSQIVVVT